MANRITLLGNDTRKDQDTQNGQINLEFNKIGRFLNSNNTSIITSIEPTLTTDLTTTSTNLVSIDALSSSFKNTSELLLVSMSFCLSGTADVFLDITIDQKSVLSKPYLFSGTNKQIITIVEQLPKVSISQHPLRLNWKVSSGTATMYKDGINKIQIMEIF